MAVSDFPLVDIPEAGGIYNGAVGQVIAAVLQTAGIYAQSDILSNFDGVFQSLGVLLASAAAAGGVASFAFFGGSRRALLFILCPIIFLFVIRTTVPGRPAVVRIGERYSPETENGQKPLVDFLVNPNGSQPRISFIYALFDNLVTSVVQSSVAFLVDTKNKEDLVRLARERVLMNVLSSRAVTPELLKLVSYGLVGNCADLARAYSDSENERDAFLKLQEAERKGADPLQMNLRRRLSQSRTDTFAAKIDMFADRPMELEASLVEYAANLGFERKNPVTCEDLWRYTAKGFLNEATYALKQQSQQAAKAGDTEVEWQKISEDVTKVLESGSPGKVHEVIAAYLLRNTILNTPHDKLTAQVFGRSHFRALPFNNMFDLFALSDAEAGAFHLSYFAASLPYVQGALLFLMSVLFPFFAVLLLIPTRATGFFIWMGIWLWIKSWDIGFAVMSVLREVLWQFLSRGIDTGRGPANIDWNQPSSVFYVMNFHDPLASYATYYNLMELLTIMVPFVTAHLCFGAAEFFDIFKSKIDKTGSLFRGRYAAGMRRYQASNLDATMNRRIGEAGLKRMLEAAKSGGGKTATGIPRWQTGDGTMARYMDGEFQMGAFKEKINQADFREISSQFTSRTMTYTGGWHTGPFRRDANLAQEPHVARYASQAHNFNVPGLKVSDKPGDYSPNLPGKPMARTSLTDAEDQ